ncbi:MAG: hypothetical protein AAF701_07465 [Pseudomonadota bacterium]
MQIISNPHRGGVKLAPFAPYPSVAAQHVADLLTRCPVAAADAFGIGSRLGP